MERCRLLRLVGYSARKLEPEEEAQQDLATIVEDLLASLPGGREQAPPITTLARHGHPAEQLLAAAAEGAQLLVLGSRGRGGFAGLLLGSVGHQCVGRARCPVVVVPGPAPVVVGA